MASSNEVEPLPQENCIYCQIASGQKPETELLYNDKQYICFRNTEPASKHHYLIVPIAHHPVASYLTQEHTGMVQRMIDVGKNVLKTQGGDMDDCRMGFHWSPFTSVEHLHMHVISPVSEMGFFNKHLIYGPNLFTFVTHDWLLNRLKAMN